MLKRLLQVLSIGLLALNVHFQALAQQSNVPTIQQRLGEAFSDKKEDELLEPDQAFKLKVVVKGPNLLIAEVTPAKGYYLYKDKIRLSLKNANGVVLKSVKFPAGEIKTDQFFGKTETYKIPVQAELSLERAPTAKGLTLVAQYQGCHEKLGVCYPPIDKSVNVTLP